MIFSLSKICEKKFNIVSKKKVIFGIKKIVRLFLADVSDNYVMNELFTNERISFSVERKGVSAALFGCGRCGKAVCLFVHD